MNKTHVAVALMLVGGWAGFALGLFAFFQLASFQNECNEHWISQIKIAYPQPEYEPQEWQLFNATQPSDSSQPSLAVPSSSLGDPPVAVG